MAKSMHQLCRYRIRAKNDLDLNFFEILYYSCRVSIVSNQFSGGSNVCYCLKLSRLGFSKYAWHQSNDCTHEIRRDTCLSGSAVTYYHVSCILPANPVNRAISSLSLAHIFHSICLFEEKLVFRLKTNYTNVYKWYYIRYINYYFSKLIWIETSTFTEVCVLPVFGYFAP